MSAADEVEIHGADCDGFCGEPGGCYGPETVECEWFLDCHEPSTSVVEHPTLGDVEICHRHVTWLLEDLHPDGSPNPTKMVPPIAAKHGARVRAILARADFMDTPGAVGRCDTCGAVEVDGPPCEHYGTPAYALA